MPARPPWVGLLPVMRRGPFQGDPNRRIIVTNDGTIVIYDPNTDEFTEYDPQGNITRYSVVDRPPPPHLEVIKSTGGNQTPKNPPGWYGPNNPLPHPPKSAQAAGLHPITGGRLSPLVAAYRRPVSVRLEVASQTGL